jgi:uncharacterized protein YndB with AHSA1/START domain
MTDSNRTGSGGMKKANIVIERTYRASVEELWELWTTKEGFESWWGPEGFRVEVHTLEARLEGKLHYDMIADAPEMIEAMRQMGEPTSHETRGWYSEFKPHERLTLTHLIDFLPGVTPYESTIVAEFFPSHDRVRMVVTLSPMHSDDVSKMQSEGFTSQLTKLDQRFAEQR